MSTPTARVVASELEFPEGPVALDDGSVLVVEIRAARLTRIWPDGSRDTVAEWPDPGSAGPNGAAIGPDGAVYVANNGGFWWHPHGDTGWLFPREPVSGASQPPGYVTGSIDRVDLATGEITVLYDTYDGHRIGGPNDLVFDSTGGMWVTDQGKFRAHDADRTGVYYASADGTSITRPLFPLLHPNGVGLSPDESILYVAETPTGRLWRWDLEGPGQVVEGSARCIANTLGHFDSLGVEADGTVVVAAISEGLLRVSPDGSEHEYVSVPDGPIITNVCWGGPELRTAYVTESGDGQLIALDWPTPGLRLPFSA